MEWDPPQKIHRYIHRDGRWPTEKHKAHCKASINKVKMISSLLEDAIILLLRRDVVLPDKTSPRGSC